MIFGHILILALSPLLRKYTLIGWERDRWILFRLSNACLGPFSVRHVSTFALMHCLHVVGHIQFTSSKEEVAAAIVAASAAAVADSSGSAATLEASAQMAHVSIHIQWVIQWDSVSHTGCWRLKRHRHSWGAEDATTAGLAAAYIGQIAGNGRSNTGCISRSGCDLGRPVRWQVSWPDSETCCTVVPRQSVTVCFKTGARWLQSILSSTARFPVEYKTLMRWSGMIFTRTRCRSRGMNTTSKHFKRSLLGKIDLVRCMSRPEGTSFRMLNSSVNFACCQQSTLISICIRSQFEVFEGGSSSGGGQTAGASFSFSMH